MKDESGILPTQLSDFLTKRGFEPVPLSLPAIRRPGRGALGWFRPSDGALVYAPVRGDGTLSPEVVQRIIDSFGEESSGGVHADR